MNTVPTHTTITAFEISNRVPTMGGWKTIGELRTSDKLIGVNGKPVYIKTLRPMATLGMKLTLADGRQYTCSEYAKLDDETTAADILSYFRTRKNRSIPPQTIKIGMPKPVRYEKHALPTHPYLLGVMTSGDTTVTKDKIIIPGLTRNVKAHILRNIPEKYLDLKTQKDCLVIGLNNALPGTKRLIRAYHGNMDLVNAYVPGGCLTANIAARRELLAGTIDATGKIMTHCCCIRGLTDTMRLDVLELAYSLGIPAMRQQPSHDISLFTNDMDSHKIWNQTQIPKIKPPENAGKIGISNIENLGYVDSIRIELAGDANQFLIENYIPVLC